MKKTSEAGGEPSGDVKRAKKPRPAKAVPTMILTKNAVQFANFKSPEEIVGFVELHATEDRIYRAIADALSKFGIAVQRMQPGQRAFQLAPPPPAPANPAR